MRKKNVNSAYVFKTVYVTISFFVIMANNKITFVFFNSPYGKTITDA